MPKKKNAKKPAPRTPAKKAAKKNVKKIAKKAPAGSTKPSPLDPCPLGTGKGASAKEIGTDLVALFNAGKAREVEKKWWSPNVVSIEGMGMSWHGKKAVEAKSAFWYQSNELLGGSAEGPYVGATGFAVKFRIHGRERATGKESTVTEVGVYTVLNGKIIQEEFMYGG